MYVSELHSAARVLAQLPVWLEDSHSVHPHKGLGMRSPREFRGAVAAGACPVEVG